MVWIRELSVKCSAWESNYFEQLFQLDWKVIFNTLNPGSYIQGCLRELKGREQVPRRLELGLGNLSGLPSESHCFSQSLAQISPLFLLTSVFFHSGIHVVRTVAPETSPLQAYPWRWLILLCPDSQGRDTDWLGGYQVYAGSKKLRPGEWELPVQKKKKKNL